jgi:hypothetical protein
VDHHRFGAVFAGQAGGRLEGMEDVHTEPRTADPSVAEQSDEQRGQEVQAAIVARLLANPRRVRRN